MQWQLSYQLNYDKSVDGVIGIWTWAARWMAQTNPVGYVRLAVPILNYVFLINSNKHILKTPTSRQKMASCIGVENAN